MGGKCVDLYYQLWLKKVKILFVSTYNLFSGFPKTCSELSRFGKIVFMKHEGVHTKTQLFMIVDLFSKGKTRNDQVFNFFNYTLVKITIFYFSYFLGKFTNKMENG